MSAVDATLNSISTHGLGSIDYAIFVGGKEQLRIEYANVEATDWENLPEPYMIFDPIFGWRLPTWNEVWQSVGFSCVQGVGMNRSSIRSAAFAGARAGFISGMGGGPGAAVLSGALAGAAAAGGAVAVACAGGAVYGTILLVGMIHIQ